MPIPHPKPALSLTLLNVLSMDTWWNFGRELKKKDISICHARFVVVIFICQLVYDACSQLFECSCG